MEVSKVDRLPLVADPTRPFEGDPNQSPVLPKPSESEKPPAPAGSAGSSVQAGSPSSSMAPDHVGKLIAEINKKLEATNRQVRFDVDTKSKQAIFRLIDSESGEILRQVPPEYMLRMAEQLSKNSEAHLIEVTI